MPDTFKNEEDVPFKNGDFLKPFPYVRFGIGAALIIFLLYQVAGGGAVALLRAYAAKDYLPWAQSLGQIFVMLLPTLWIAGRTPISFKTMLRLEREPTARQWVFGLLGVIAIQLFAQGFVTLQEYILPGNVIEFYKSLESEFDELYRSLLGSETIMGLVRSLFIGAVIPAIAEETLFRGVMQRSLEEAMPFKKAIIVTGVIFAAVHFNLPMMIPLTIIGIYLGALAYYSQSLLLPIAAHFFNNALSVFGLYKETEELTAPEITTLQAVLLLIAGLSGLIICTRQVISEYKKKPGK